MCLQITQDTSTRTRVRAIKLSYHSSCCPPTAIRVIPSLHGTDKSNAQKSDSKFINNMVKQKGVVVILWHAETKYWHSRSLRQKSHFLPVSCKCKVEIRCTSKNQAGMKKEGKCKFHISYVNGSKNIFNTCMVKSANWICAPWSLILWVLLYNWYIGL